MLGLQTPRTHLLAEPSVSRRQAFRKDAGVDRLGSQSLERLGPVFVPGVCRRSDGAPLLVTQPRGLHELGRSDEPALERGGDQVALVRFDRWRSTFGTTRGEGDA